MDVPQYQILDISIHALLAESDRHWACPDGSVRLFLSTLSLRRATLRVLDGSKSSIISIHALLAESDLIRYRISAKYTNFYPRSPCGERLLALMISLLVSIFLSTLSLRRATVNGGAPSSYFVNFYPRSPCGERLTSVVSSTGTIDFYPRSPCGERLVYALKITDLVLFLSTLSLRRATAKVHKTVGHFCAYETNFMEIASSC